MYVRWIVRGHKNKQANITFHDAYLVESYRDEEGAPRQRTIEYLGNIREIDGGFPVIERELFLLRADYILQGIDEVSPADHEQIMDILHQKVPPTKEEEIEHGFLSTLRWYIYWWRKHDTVPDDEEVLALFEKAKKLPEQAMHRYINE